MDAPKCLLRVQERDNAARVRVEGRGTLGQSALLRRFGDRCAGHGVKVFRLDLSACSYMDSTFLGTLLYLHRTLACRAHADFALIAPSPECRRLFIEMGIADVLPVVQETPASEGTWISLADGGDDPLALRNQMLQAHQELARIPNASGDQFRAVMACLRPECEGSDE